ncbi:YmdB family metallophosphoesterase [bacterium]|nr:YmdB family metallophosphoesterase [bacterium]
MKTELKVLFLGDMVGRIGRKTVQKFLETNKANYDFIIANVENASHGFGLTLKNHDELAACGINCMTSGNHIWDKKDVFEYIDNSNYLIRPLNYDKSVRGVGYRIFNDKFLVINLLGKTFMPQVDCPFKALQALSKEMSFEDKITIIDFHAEATAEKECMGYFAQSLGAKAVFGTHTHVQTADEKILNGTCAYITDAGFTGGTGGVIGMDYEISLKRILTSIPERFDVVDSKESVLCGVEVVFDNTTNNPISIKRVFEKYKDEDNED